MINREQNTPPPPELAMTEPVPGEGGDQTGETSDNPETQQLPEQGEQIRVSETPPEDPRTPQIREQASQRRESHYEVQGIARSADYFKQFGDQAPKHLANVLESKSCFDLQKAGGERPAETVANELLNDIEPYIDGLRQQLEASQLTKEQQEQGVIAIREMLYSLVTKGILSGGKIKEMLGSIRFQEKPDTSVSGEAYGQLTDSTKIKGMSVFNTETGKFDIYFYGGFFTGSQKSQSHVARHEFSHVIAEGTNLFDQQTYQLFLQYASGTEITSEQIAEVGAKAPELAELLKIMQNAEAGKGVWNGYIRSRIEKLSSLSGTALAEERRAVASELVAEMIVPYLESGEDELGYLEKRFESLNQEQLVTMLLAQAKKPDGTSCQNSQELSQFCQERGIVIDFDNAPPQVIVGALASVPEFQAIFGIGKRFFDKLRKSFENRGQAIQADPNRGYKHEEDELADFDELMDFSEYYDEYYGYSGSGEGKTPRSAGPPQESFFSKFWNFITGKNSKPKLPSGTLQAPGQIPKAA